MAAWLLLCELYTLFFLHTCSNNHSSFVVQRVMTLVTQPIRSRLRYSFSSLRNMDDDDVLEAAPALTMMALRRFALSHWSSCTIECYS
jgi:hypothetical protein